MKRLIPLLSLLLIVFNTNAQSPEPITVTTQSISVTGALIVSNWKSEHPNEHYPNYPKMYYAFAEGDEIIIDFATANKKGTQKIQISEYESNSILYSNNQFQSLENLKIKIPKTSVYKFEFATSHMFNRQCNVTIKRIPATETTKLFNCNVTWKTINDTTFTVIEEKRKISSSYEAVTLQSPIDQYLNGGRNSRFFGGKSRIGFPITLPDNTVEWYYTFGATRSNDQVKATKSNMKLFSELTRLIDQTGVLSFGINALTQPPGADYCDVYLLKPENYESFLNKYDDKWSYLPEGTRQNLKSGVVKIKNCCKENTYFIGFKNPDFGFGINVIIEVVAVTEKVVYETVQVKKPVSVAQKQIPFYSSL